MTFVNFTEEDLAVIRSHPFRIPDHLIALYDHGPAEERTSWVAALKREIDHFSKLKKHTPESAAAATREQLKDPEQRAKLAQRLVLRWGTHRNEDDPEYELLRSMTIEALQFLATGPTP